MSKIRELVRNKWFVFGGSVLILLLLLVEVRQFRQRYQIQKEIKSLQEQADQLNKNNQELQSMLSYLRTDEYKERAAREQLNLKKEGEFVFSFAEPEPQLSVAEQPTQLAEFSNGSNYKKWFQYFFNN